MLASYPSIISFVQMIIKVFRLEQRNLNMQISFNQTWTIPSTSTPFDLHFNSFVSQQRQH